MAKRIRLRYNKRQRTTSNSWCPEWSHSVESWTAKQVSANLWRFDALDDFDDVMQEARVLFWTLWKKYPVVNEMPHFFAIYRTSLNRFFIDKARLRQNSAIDQTVNAEEVAEELNLAGNMPNSGYLSLLIQEMPDELKTVLEGLTSGRVRLRLPKSTTSIRPRENDNMRLRRRFSLSAADPVGDLRGYFADT